MNKHLEIALGEFGQLEVAGKLSNKAILNYYKTVGHKWVEDDSVPWCAAFVGYCLETAGVPSTKSLAARSYLNWGVETAKPSVGDVVILSRGTNVSQGHVGFYVKHDKEFVWILGGNQADTVNISKFDISRLLGYRKIPVGKPEAKNDIIIEQPVKPVVSTMNTQVKNRLKSLGWRTGMMTASFVVEYLVQNITGLGLDPRVTMFLGLILGELSKYLNTKKAQ